LSPKTRLNLVRQLFEDEKKVIISDYEVNAGESVPTIKTVNYLYDKYKPEKIYLIIGDDHLDTLSKWNSFDELNKSVEFVVINRHDKKTDYKSLPLKIDISSSKLREHLDIDSIPKKIQNEVNEIWKKEYNK
jgi:nicotinate-nucleotide adenylyltransferase